MADLSYCGLPEFGLPLVTPGMPSFAALVRDIESRPGPGPFQPAIDPDRAAVLLNQSGKAIFALDLAWHYTAEDGHRSTRRLSTLGSSAQREVLSGRAQVGRDPFTFILPNSKRLITEQGIVGNNLDVLRPDELSHSRGYGGGSGVSAGGSRAGTEGEPTTAKLVLDLVILEDGLCVGPDESGLFAALNEFLELQRSTAQEAAAELRKGASVGRIFEIVRPLARRQNPEAGRDGKPMQAMSLLTTFGNEAIYRLVNAGTPESLAWFENAAQVPVLQLRRP